MYVSTNRRRYIRDDSPYPDFRLALRYSQAPRPGGLVPVTVQTRGHTVNVSLPGNPLDCRLAARRGWRDPLTFVHAGRNSWYVGGFPQETLGFRVGHVVDAAAGASAHHDWFGPLSPAHWVLDWLPSLAYTGPELPYLCSIKAGCYTAALPFRLGRRRGGLGAFTAAPASIQTVLQNASASSGVPYSILQALAFQESSYNPAAVSDKGAQGLLQLMPATAASLGVTNPMDAQQNANAGASYLAQLYQKYGNWNDALVAYNEGPGNFASSGAYPSSAAYASTILTNAGVSSSAPAAAAPGGTDFADMTGQPDFSSLTNWLPSIDFTDPFTLAGLALGLGLVLYFAA